VITCLGRSNVFLSYIKSQAKEIKGFFSFSCNGPRVPASKRQIKQTKFMEVAVIGVLIPIVFILGAIFVIIYVRKFENLERMAIIDKGLSPDLFKRSYNTSGALRASLLFIGGGIGLLMGYWLDRAFNMEEVAYFSMILIFGGLGLGLAYLIEEKKARDKV
jgi:hypothetical protein